MGVLSSSGWILTHLCSQKMSVLVTSISKETRCHEMSIILRDQPAVPRPDPVCSDDRSHPTHLHNGETWFSTSDKLFNHQCSGCTVGRLWPVLSVD